MQRRTPTAAVTSTQGPQNNYDKDLPLYKDGLYGIYAGGHCEQAGNQVERDLIVFIDHVFAEISEQIKVW